MAGLLGSFLVIGQMALLSMGAPAHVVMFFGLGAACCWILHALERDDRALLFVNFAVGGFAFMGLIP